MGDGDGSDDWRDRYDNGRYNGEATAMAMDGATALRWQ